MGPGKSWKSPGFFVSKTVGILYNKHITEFSFDAAEVVLP